MVSQSEWRQTIEITFVVANYWLWLIFLGLHNSVIWWVRFDFLLLMFFFTVWSVIKTWRKLVNLKKVVGQREPLPGSVIAIISKPPSKACFEMSVTRSSTTKANKCNWPRTNSAKDVNKKRWKRNRFAIPVSECLASTTTLQNGLKTNQNGFFVCFDKCFACVVSTRR